MSVFDLPAHPAADVFPMLEPEELQDLAEDIAEHGLRRPVLVADIDGERYVVDGRNRLAACRLIGLEPDVEVVDGDEDAVLALIASLNVQRRHLSKGQQAMALAMLFPKSQQGKRTDLDPTSEFNSEVSGRYIRQARTVLRVSKTLATEVMAGGKSLPVAYADAREIRDRRKELLARSEAIVEDGLQRLSAFRDEARAGAWSDVWHLLNGDTRAAADFMVEMAEALP